MKKAINNKIKLIAIILFNFFISCSCKTQANMLPSSVMGMAIDKLPCDEPISITVEIVNTKAAAPSEDTSGKVGGSVYEESKGKSLYDSIENLSDISPARIDFTHIGIIILSKELCESGISDVMDYLSRDRQFRTTNRLLVAENGAKEIIKSSSPNEDITSIGLYNTMLRLEKNNSIIPIDIQDYTSRLNRVSKSSYIPVASIYKSGESSGNEVKINKMAIFKKDKLTGILTEEESKTLMWLSGNRTGHMVVSPLLTGKYNHNVTVDVIKRSAKIIPHIKSGRIKLEVNCTGDGIVREIDNVYMNEESVNDIKQSIEQELKKKLISLIDTSQKSLNTDFIGFSEKIYNNNPKFWLSIKDNWDSIYPNMEYDVNFNIRIINTGIIKDRPFR